MEKSTRSRGLFIAAGVCVLAYALALCFAMYSLWADGTYGWATTLLSLLQRILPIPITFAFALIFKHTPQTITFILIAQELQLFFGFLHDIVPPRRLDVYAIRSSLLPLIAYGILLLSSALAGSKTRQRLTWPALLSPAFALVCLILNIRGDSRLEYRIVYNRIRFYFAHGIGHLLLNRACASVRPRLSERQGGRCYRTDQNL